METLNRVLEGQLRVNEAAVVLGVSERHAWRILAAYRREGAAAVAHGNRGRRPANATAEDVRRQVIELARTRYVGVNHTHLTELLAEREGLILGRSTVRNILMRAGMESPRRRRPPRHRVRRKRLPQEGMLVQIDGSDHDWLEDRGPRMTLLLAVDDATGAVPGALFRRQEDSHGYFFLSVVGDHRTQGDTPGVVQRSPRRLLAYAPFAEARGGGIRKQEETNPVRSSAAGSWSSPGVRLESTSEGEGGTGSWDVSGSVGE